MNSKWIGYASAVALVAVAGCAGGDDAEGDVAVAPAVECDSAGLTLPDGFCAQVVRDGLGTPRHLAVAANGDIYVAIAGGPGSSGGQGIVALRDTDGDGTADQMESFGEFSGTGIAIHDDYLYFATDTSVVRYAMPQDGTLVPTGPAEPVVSGFPVQRAHAAKTMAFDDGGRMWVNVGAPTNNCGGETDRQPGATGERPCSNLERQAGVWQFDANVTGQTQADGVRYASGLRNAMAIAYSPTGGELMGLQHGRDQLDVVDSEDFTPEGNATRPAEEFLVLEEGGVYSWPYCFYDLESDQHLQAPEYGGDGESVGECDQYPDPVAVFGGHWAPIDLLFYTGDQFPERFRNGAFIAFHGSWNRAPLSQEGYQVMFQPLNGLAASGEAEGFANGFAGMSEVASPDQAQHRPVGLAQGPDGSLYISDDAGGTIWRVSYVGSE